MIEYRMGDILKSNAQALVNPVNCVGVMGKGLAAQFKKAFPDNFSMYALMCDARKIKPGTLFTFENASLENHKLIINFPTKRHWRDESLLIDIQKGLECLVNVINRLQITSIAIPPLGCGLGGLDWKVVKPMIEEAVKDLDEVKAVIYEMS